MCVLVCLATAAPLTFLLFSVGPRTAAATADITHSRVAL